MAEEKNAIFTLEDVYGEKARQTPEAAAPAQEPTGGEYQPPLAAPRRGVQAPIGIEEAYGVKPEAERKPLEREIGETYPSAIAKGVPTAAIKGVADMPILGGIGSMRELADVGVGWITSQISGRPFEDVMRSKRALSEAAKKPSETAMGRIEQAFVLPTGEELAKPYLERFGEYEPTSGMGKAAMAGLSGAVSGLGVSGKTGALEKAADIGTRSTLAGVGSAAAERTASLTGSLPLALAAGVVAPTAAKSIPTFARAHLMPGTVSEELAGKVIKEAAQDEGAVRQALLAQETLAPGVTPTSAQKARDIGISNLERRLAGDEALGTGGMHRSQTNQALADSNEALERAIETGAQRLNQDMTAAYNLTGTAPSAAASERARNIFAKMEEAADKAVGDLWKVPALESAGMFRQKIVDQLDEYMKSLSPTKRNAIDPNVLKTIEDLRAMKEAQIPISFIQDLRHDALVKGRKAFSDQDSVTGGINYALADELRGILSNDKNFRFLGMRDGKSAPKEWVNAVEATRLYHEKFNEGFLKSLNAKTDPNVEKIPFDATFKAMIQDPKMATQNLAQLQKATDGQITPMFSDFMVSELTRNGTKIVNPKEVDNFLGKNAAIIDATPGLRDRLVAIKEAGAGNQLSAALLANLKTPDKLVDVFNNNRGEIARLTKNSPQDREYFQMLEQSARRLSKLPVDKDVPLPTLNKLADGSVADVLYGVASGRIAGGLALAGATKLAALEQVTGAPIMTALGSFVTGAGATARYPGVRNIIDTILTGDVRQRAVVLLHEARTNPELMARLMDKATPDNMAAISKMHIGTSSLAPIPEALEERQERRATRASGGRVSRDIEAAADALIRAAESTKKALGRETETLLNHDDNTIAHALEVANKAI